MFLNIFGLIIANSCLFCLVFFGLLSLFFQKQAGNEGGERLDMQQSSLTEIKPEILQ